VAPAAEPTIERVVLRPELLGTIASAGAAAGPRETGGPLFGTLQRSWNGRSLSLVAPVLGTVPSPAGRTSSVTFGHAADGERAASALRWLRDVTGLELLHLGDWHTHPFGPPEPSLGDHKTAERMAAAGAPCWLLGVAVGEQICREEIGADASAATVERKSAHTAELHLYDALAGLAPVHVSVDGVAIPRLPPLPWHVADPHRFAAECRLLAAAGFSTAIRASGDATGVVLRARRNGRAATVATGIRYPLEPPRVLESGRRRVKARAAWSPDRFLVDLVQEVC
jgi:proteasome lid subunit RPN8/RPN11